MLILAAMKKKGILLDPAISQIDSYVVCLFPKGHELTSMVLEQFYSDANTPDFIVSLMKIGVSLKA